MKYIFHIVFNLLLILITCLFLSISCGTFNNLPPSTDIVNVRDSIIYHQIDSVVYTPVEVIKDIVPEYDTLKMSTSLAEAEAYVDTTLHLLRGSIKNKKGITEKIKYVDRVEYRDSIQIKEVPYPVEVEKVKNKHYWYEPILWLLSLLYVVPLIIKLVMRIYGIKK